MGQMLSDATGGAGFNPSGPQFQESGLPGGLPPSVSGATATAPGGGSSTDPVAAYAQNHPGGILGALQAGFHKIQDMSQFLGATPKERQQNAMKLAASMKDISSLSQNLKDSTLIRRMLELQMNQQARTPLAMSGGSGGQGISPIGQELAGSGQAAPAWRGF